MGVKRMDQLTTDYMLKILAHLNPQHPYFQRGYNPYENKRKEKAAEKYFDNRLQILTGAPKLGLYTNGRANMVNKKPKKIKAAETDANRLERYKAERKELKRKMKELGHLDDWDSRQSSPKKPKV